MRPVVATCCLAILLAGCSGSGSSDNSYREELAWLTADFLIVGLESGQVSIARSVPPDLLTNPAFKSTHMVFRRVHGSHQLGAPAGAIGASEDPAQQAVSVGISYVGVFEVTQAQWQRIAGAEPWLLLDVAAGDVEFGDDHPVVGASHNQVLDALAAYNIAVSFALELPSNAEWEAACRAGSTALFSWGDDLHPAIAAEHALVWDTAEDLRGAQAVASRAPNALSFFDMHGNVGELVAGGEVRGGSWNSALATARSAHRAVIDSDTCHATVGFRLTCRPR